MFEPHPTLDRPRFLVAHDEIGRLTLVDPDGALVPGYTYVDHEMIVRYVVATAIQTRTPLLLEVGAGAVFVVQPSGRIQPLALPASAATISSWGGRENVAGSSPAPADDAPFRPVTAAPASGTFATALLVRARLLSTPREHPGGMPAPAARLVVALAVLQTLAVVSASVYWALSL